MTLHEQLHDIMEKYQAMEASLSAPELLANPAEYAKRLKEYHALSPLVEAYQKWKEVHSASQQAEELMNDPTADTDLRAMAVEEWNHAKESADALHQKILTLLLPRDPNDDKNVMMEIRAGTGGEEAALFAADLYRMYCMYAAASHFEVARLTSNETPLGGFREITFMIKGDGAYSRFRFESGVHRVQRVPVTESQGRIQTSAATVAVLPEAEEVNVQLNPADLVFESCKSSGAGGQHVNKTESAVRLTHKPSGIVVECDQERSQFKNRDIALTMLRTRLYDLERSRQEAEIADHRRSQIGSGDRSQRIRTYNFPQGRVTDHRIGLTIYHLDAFLNGDIGEMIDALIQADTAEKLRMREDPVASSHT